MERKTIFRLEADTYASICFPNCLSFYIMKHDTSLLNDTTNALIQSLVEEQGWSYYVDGNLDATLTPPNWLTFNATSINMADPNNICFLKLVNILLKNNITLLVNSVTFDKPFELEEIQN